MNRRVMRCLIVVIVLLLGCDEAVKLENEHGKYIVGKCGRTLSPTFLVHYKGGKEQFREFTQWELVPPNSVLAPFSVEEYLSGSAPDQPIFEVVMVLPEDTRFVVGEAWSLQSFESSMVAVMAAVEGVAEGRVDVSQLLNPEWRLALGDGEISDREREILGAEAVFDPKFVADCEANSTSDPGKAP